MKEYPTFFVCDSGSIVRRKGGPRGVRNGWKREFSIEDFVEAAEVLQRYPPSTKMDKHLRYLARTAAVCFGPLSPLTLLEKAPVVRKKEEKIKSGAAAASFRVLSAWQPPEVAGPIRAWEEDRCMICHEEEDVVPRPLPFCQHKICLDCFRGYRELRQHPKCPLCEAPMLKTLEIVSRDARDA